MTNRRNYTREFKLAAVRKVVEQGLTTTADFALLAGKLGTDVDGDPIEGV